LGVVGVAQAGDSVADQVRAHCLERYVAPARKRGDLAVGIRSGDVHTELGLAQRLPAVCAALGSDRFESLARVRRVAIEGPLNGPSTVFIYRLL